MEERPQKERPGTTHSHNQDGKRFGLIQQSTNTIVRSLDGAAADERWASQLLHNTGQGSRYPTGHTHEDVRNSPRVGDSYRISQ
jgi:hypothetical protein